MSNAGRLGDFMACGDIIIEGSPNVFINGLPVARQGDGTAGHDNWVPNYMLEGSQSVFVNGIPVCRVGDRHVGHLTYQNTSFHQTYLVTGSPNVFING